MLYVYMYNNYFLHSYFHPSFVPTRHWTSSTPHSSPQSTTSSSRPASSSPQQCFSRSGRGCLPLMSLACCLGSSLWSLASSSFMPSSESVMLLYLWWVLQWYMSYSLCLESGRRKMVGDASFVSCDFQFPCILHPL